MGITHVSPGLRDRVLLDKKWLDIVGNILTGSSYFKIKLMFGKFSGVLGIFVFNSKNLCGIFIDTFEKIDHCRINQEKDAWVNNTYVPHGNNLGTNPRMCPTATISYNCWFAKYAKIKMFKR